MAENNPGKTGNNWNKLQVKKRVQKILSLNSLIKSGVNDINKLKLTGINWIFNFWKIWKRVRNFPVYFLSFFFLGGGVWQEKSTFEVPVKASYYNYSFLYNSDVLFDYYYYYYYYYYSMLNNIAHIIRRSFSMKPLLLLTLNRRWTFF